MPSPSKSTTEFRVADLSANRSVSIDLAPNETVRAEIAAELGLVALRKLTFRGALSPEGKRGWRLQGTLGATAVQSCVVTLEPVVTRIDETITRHYASKYDEPLPGSETEMPEDDSTEPLEDVISVQAAVLEALSLALPAYPRAKGAELGEAVYTKPGNAPMTDEEARPFASLKALRDKLDDAE